ncbi:hypothetical protein [Kitasatospora sp. NPDC088351]|uniref:hypothetical protein n=1 Tax=Kitasatospora sp. NPDC088351 TaxID=3155180 RepID=UPI003412F589
MWLREKPAEVFSGGAVRTRVRGVWNAGSVAAVTVSRFAETLADRQTAEPAVRAIDRKYALGLESVDREFDFTMPAKFRARSVEHGREDGLITVGGKQYTDLLRSSARYGI